MAATKGQTPPAGPPQSPDVTTGGPGGGNGQDNPQPQSPPAVETASAKSRKGFVTQEDFEFTPASLVGSWFLRYENGEAVWLGVVVAEPGQGKYLVQIDREDAGVLQSQRLIPLERMVSDDDGYEWRFYDTETAARGAWADRQYGS